MTGGALGFERVVKRYIGTGEVVQAVDGVTLTVKPGELVALYGPSGSGKTTLLLLAAGLLEADQGEVRFDGRDLSSLSDSEVSAYLRRDVGFVYQTPELIAGMPALDNATTKLLADGRALTEARDLARPLLQRLGLGERLSHRPAQLSGGERQRVAVARALVHRPRLVLADEPTGNLDSRRGQEILSLLADYCHEGGVPGLLVTHDPEVANVADRVHWLRDGRLANDSTGEPDRRDEAGRQAPAGFG